MPDKDAGAPRVYIARHGETEWSQTGRYTGITELELTPHGTAQVQNTAKVLVGPGKLIDPARVARVYVSPRKRAQMTFKLLFSGGSNTAEEGILLDTAKISTTDRLAEWGYGSYEGLKTSEIRALRKTHGLDVDRPWDIWRDGCEGEGGEFPSQVAARLDDLINEIRAIQAGHMHGEPGPADVVLVAHGHILRAFVKRWLGHPLDFPLSLMLEPETTIPHIISKKVRKPISAIPNSVYAKTISNIKGPTCGSSACFVGRLAQTALSLPWPGDPFKHSHEVVVDSVLLDRLVFLYTAKDAVSANQSPSVKLEYNTHRCIHARLQLMLQSLAGFGAVSGGSPAVCDGNHY
ncbi:Phosphoglycerate mutase [Rasamsonia emersonii CBS 393.64]|uniref:Phosphoglycerate mutase n=1 Tax=Rasamsonia emersonii (strain ATCC 16479 / CBS 393.64 / IMI 116815) TaxID=1408163 RepID=A0A0F4YMW7_RASE3|nr:Phosphoglycerate mutase [Rasamsonia emersonii CBS 393.64]KKA19171.1 Phosphoglycerate mutase [Rasamsonia emersonii CBS 393.64]